MEVYNYITSVPKKWNYFIIKDTITVTIVQHLPAPAICGFFATASVTIVQTETNELIRILDLCNTSDEYNVNQKIRVAPQSAPEFDVQFAFEYVEQKDKNRIVISSKYDLEILNTSWGTLIK